MDSLIDVNFMSFMEYSGGEDSVTFARVDADVSGLTEDSDEGKDLNAEDLEKLFRKALGKMCIRDRPTSAWVTLSSVMVTSGRQVLVNARKYP